MFLILKQKKVYIHPFSKNYVVNLDLVILKGLSTLLIDFWKLLNQNIFF